MIDLRSDTVTRPTEGMRRAMLEAPVGDDVFGEDPTVNRLEEYVADLLGKEAALYAPSGTMTNQIGVQVSTNRGEEVLLHEGSHIFVYEAGAPAMLSGVQLRILSGENGIPNTIPPPLPHQADGCARIAGISRLKRAKGNDSRVREILGAV